jgi:vacuolar-type H+-ATPase subunit H
VKILELLDELEEIIETGTSLILTGKIMIDPDDVLDIIKEIRSDLPEEIEQAKWIKSERQKIIEEAKTEYETVLKDAQRQADILIENDEITLKAKAKAEYILRNAEATAKHLKLSTFDYIDGILFNFEKKMDQMNAEHVMSMFNHIEKTFDMIGTTISENRSEIKDLAYNTQMDIKE